MITPIDIRKLEFNKALRGYDAEEVQAALESIAKELESHIKDNASLREKLKGAEEKLSHFKLMEKTLQDSIITMQTTLEEKRKNAEQEAELIIQEARHNASGEYRQYKEQINNLRAEIHALENQKSKYFIRFKSFLMSQLDWLNTMEKDEDFSVDTPDVRHAKNDPPTSKSPAYQTPTSSQSSRKTG